jgi:hypothetical protein
MAEKKKSDSDPQVTEQDVDVAAEVDEQARRNAAQFNGGGAWPVDLLLSNYVGGRPQRRVVEAYTSHE